jgi:hypothetical protein
MPPRVGSSSPMDPTEGCGTTQPVTAARGLKEQGLRCSRVRPGVAGGLCAGLGEPSSDFSEYQDVLDELLAEVRV